MKNIIFDIGNVVVQWRSFNVLSHLFPDEEVMQDQLQKIGFFEWNAEQDRGRSWLEGLAEIENKQPESMHIFQTYVKHIEGAHRERVPGTSELIEALHNTGVCLYGLTNASLEAFEFMTKTAPSLARFRHITVSAKVGYIKPQPDIFEYCLSHNNLERSETLFIDDSVKNCEGAEAAGISAHHFTDAIALEDALIKANVL